MTMDLLDVQSSNISLNTGASILSWRKTCCRYCIASPRIYAVEKVHNRTRIWIDKRPTSLCCVNVAAS